MNWQALRAQIQHANRANAQAAQLCDLALREVEVALQTLARWGFHFHLAEGYKVPVEYPRTVYHFSKGVATIYCPQDLEELGHGWALSPFDAAIEFGTDVQYEGRGGVRRHNYMKTDGSATRDEDPNRVHRWKMEFFEERRLRNGHG